MDNWYVYIIRCADNALYTGITKDPDRRLREHQGKGTRGSKYLRGKGLLTLVWQTRVSDRSVASRLEARIRRLSKDNKENLIQGDAMIQQLLGIE